MYSVRISDKGHQNTNEWLESFDSDAKLAIDDKVVIETESFQSNLFLDCNLNEYEEVIKELNNSSNSNDIIDTGYIGQYRFYVKDIEYFLLSDDKARTITAQLYLSKTI